MTPTDANALMSGARCYRCIPAGLRRAVFIWQLDQWLTNTTITRPNEYWNMEQPVSPRVGMIQGVQLTGGVAGVTGLIGRGISLPTSSAETYFASSNKLPYPAQVGLSFTLWIKFAQDTGTGIPLLYFSFGSGFIGLFPDVDLVVPNLRMQLFLNGQHYVSFGEVNYNTWYFCAMTFTQATREAKLYVNDSDPVTTSGPGAAPLAWPTGELTLSSTNDGYGLTLDEVGVWMNHVLTPEEVLLLYNGGAGKTYPFRP